MQILSFGEIVWDVYDHKKFLGGAPLNFAAHSAKHGEDVYMLSAVGTDELGSEALKQINNWSISDKYIAVNPTKGTGRCNVTLDDDGVPTYNLLQDVAYDYIECEDITETFDVLYFGTLALRSSKNFKSIERLLKKKLCKDVFVDLNIRPPFYSKETLEFSVQNATVLKISLEELQAVLELLEINGICDYKKAAEILSKKFKNLKCVIITLGPKGAYALDCINKKDFLHGCNKVKVVSTVGAGDSFSAAFLYKYLRNNDMNRCLEYATSIAEFVITHCEAVPDYQPPR